MRNALIALVALLVVLAVFTFLWAATAPQV
jgi:hypothetical protein